MFEHGAGASYILRNFFIDKNIFKLSSPAHSRNRHPVSGLAGAKNQGECDLSCVKFHRGAAITGARFRDQSHFDLPAARQPVQARSRHCLTIGLCRSRRSGPQVKRIVAAAGRDPGQVKFLAPLRTFGQSGQGGYVFFLHPPQAPPHDLDQMAQHAVTKCRVKPADFLPGDTGST